jgi:hypothetical protein
MAAQFYPVEGAVSLPEGARPRPSSSPPQPVGVWLSCGAEAVMCHGGGCVQG